MVEYCCCLESNGRCFEGNKRKDVELVIDTLIGSKGKVALFTALFDGRRRSTHIRELARNVGLSAPSLMREAKALVKIGLLREEKDGNRVDYCANVDSPLYPALTELVQKTAGPEAALRDAFADSDNDVVFIYGSRARGCERADSDCDVFVVGREGLRKTAARAGEVASRMTPTTQSTQNTATRIISAVARMLSTVRFLPSILLRAMSVLLPEIFVKQITFSVDEESQQHHQ